MTSQDRLKKAASYLEKDLEADVLQAGESLKLAIFDAGDELRSSFPSVVEHAEVLIQATRMLASKAAVQRSEFKMALKEAQLEADRRVSDLQPYLDEALKHLSIADRLIYVLKNNPEVTFAPDQAAFAIECDNVDTVRKTMLRLANEGKIEKVGRGRYRCLR
jgi:hypothetical protein